MRLVTVKRLCLMHRDICPILKDPQALRTVTDVIAGHLQKSFDKVDVIVGKLKNIGTGRDCRATLKLGRGAPLVTQYWGGTRHFFLLNLNNFKNIGGRGTCSPYPPPPYSVVPDRDGEENLPFNT